MLVRYRSLLLATALVGAAPALTAFPISTVDDRCQSVTVEEAPQRIVALLPFYAEILLDLGAGERIVGVAEFPDELPALRDVPSVGPAFAASREQIVALRPDLVLGATDWDGLRAALEAVGTTVFTVGCFAGAPDFGAITGPDDVFVAIAAVATVITGGAGPGEAIVERITADLAAVVRVVRPSVAVLYPDPSGVAPPTVAGLGTPEHAAIEAAGGQAAFEQEGYPQVSVEELVRVDPQFVITDPSRVSDIAQDARFATLQAVRERHVCGIKASGWTSSAVGATVRELAALLHPAAFDRAPTRCEVP